MDPWVGKIPWRREGLPTPVFWPGEFHELYSPSTETVSDLLDYANNLTLKTLHAPTPLGPLPVLVWPTSLFRCCLCSLLVWVLSCSVVSEICDPVDCSPPSSSVHGILQARLRVWVAKTLLQPVRLQILLCVLGTSPVALVVKGPACQSRRCKRHRFGPWVRKIPWRRACRHKNQGPQ